MSAESDAVRPAAAADVDALREAYRHGARDCSFALYRGPGTLSDPPVCVEYDTVPASRAAEMIYPRAQT